MNKGLEALSNLYARASVHCPIDEINIILEYHDILENAIKELEIIKKCIYMGHSGAIGLTDYGFEHREELKKVL